MSQRERFLSIIIGGLFLAIAFQWAFNQYRSAIRSRTTRLNTLNNEADNLQTQWLEGARAERQLGEYKIRSLSSDGEVAKSSYQSWLLETVRRVGVADAVVDPVGDVPVGELYTKFGFRVSGKTDLPGLVDLVYAIQARDQLHRIREMQFAPLRQSARRADGVEGDTSKQLSVVLSIDAVSLNLADASPPAPSETPSWRITRTLDESRDTILNRNFFQPPNQPPEYLGDERLVAFRGKENVLAFSFSDPEKHGIDLSLEGELPEWAKWDAERGNLVVTPPEAIVTEDETENAPALIEEFEIQVIATDNGYPHRQTTQTLVVKTQASPPPPAEETKPPGFDDSTQTFLTGLVRGGGEWAAWMNVRTRGKTLKLKVGDEFEIGTVQGKVTEVTAKQVTLEINGASYELRPRGKLSDVLSEEEP